MTEYANTPQTITIAVGDSVRWRNRGEQNHDVASGVDPVPDGAWSSPEVAPGESWKRTFTEPGVFPYFCTLHPTLMPGTVIVEG